MAQKNLERRSPGAHAAAAPRRGVLASFTLRTLAKNRARTVVTIIGIALAARSRRNAASGRSSTRASPTSSWARSQAGSTGASTASPPRATSGPVH